MTRRTQTTRINGRRVRLVIGDGSVSMKDAPVLEHELQAAQVKALRAMPEYGRQFLLAGGMEAGKRGPRDRAIAVATGLTKGHPDLTIFLPCGRVGMIENKNVEGRLSKEQRERHAALAAIGHHVVIIRASSAEQAAGEAVRQVREWLAANNRDAAQPAVSRAL